MAEWYSRPVFFVAAPEQSLAFYRDKLGFSEAWRYEEEGQLTVVQVNHGDCEIILTKNEDRAGGARVFVSLEADEMAALEALITERDVSATRGWWGYPVIEIRDPDGNELFFPVEET